MTTAAPTTVNQLSSASVFYIVSAPASDVAMPDDVKGIYVTSAGNLSVNDHASNPNTSVIAVTAGQLLPIRPKQINAATTADVMVLAG